MGSSLSIQKQSCSPESIEALRILIYFRHIIITTYAVRNLSTGSVTMIDRPEPPTSTPSHALQSAYTRTRLCMLQDSDTVDQFYRSLSSLTNRCTVALCLSEGSFLPFLLARLGVQQVSPP